MVMVEEEEEAEDEVEQNSSHVDCGGIHLHSQYTYD